MREGGVSTHVALRGAVDVPLGDAAARITVQAGDYLTITYVAGEERRLSRTRVGAIGLPVGQTPGLNEKIGLTNPPRKDEYLSTHWLADLTGDSDTP